MLENLNQINLMNKIKQNISNIIILFFILLGIYSLFFGIFTIKTDYDWSIKIIFSGLLCLEIEGPFKISDIIYYMR